MALSAFYSNATWYKDLVPPVNNISFFASNFSYEPFSMFSQLLAGAALAVTASSRALSARQASDVSPGYSASNVQMTGTGMTADLSLAGPATNSYGNDIENLRLFVNYDTGTPCSVGRHCDKNANSN
jgi:hypothetical protein